MKFENERHLRIHTDKDHVHEQTPVAGRKRDITNLKSKQKTSPPKKIILLDETDNIKCNNTNHLELEERLKNANDNSKKVEENFKKEKTELKNQINALEDINYKVRQEFEDNKSLLEAKKSELLEIVSEKELITKETNILIGELTEENKKLKDQNLLYMCHPTVY